MMGNSARPRNKRNSTPGERRLVAAAEAGKYLGVSQWTIRRWKAQERIPFVRLGRAIRYDLDDLDEMIEVLKVLPGRFKLAGDDNS